jgi:Na+/proline symporter/nitrogen-specific signal transduction histidine kinase
MFAAGTILLFSFGYLGGLFAIAYFGDRRAEQGRSIISNPYVYALSLAVYCSAWTFYGSVGQAATSGIGFLPIYLGPTLVVTIGLVVIKKIIRICKMHRITSIADFIASRYGKSAFLGGMVTVIAVLGIIPYISLQLKAISTSFALISRYPDFRSFTMPESTAFYQETAFYVALVLAVFAILFGTRHLETTERHEGLVAAIAFESLVKIVAFVTVGAFITFGLFDGFRDLFARARALSDFKAMLTIGDSPGNYMGWSMYLLLSGLVVVFLPRQFQVTVVENVNEKHLNKGVWLFPLYLLCINIFVLPIAIAGRLVFADAGVEADFFLLALPMQSESWVLAVLSYIGGMSAATGMVIVETIALSTMICNDLVMPFLLRRAVVRFAIGQDMSRVLLSIRRWSIVLVLLLGYAYFHFIAEFYSLVSIGLISFVAVAQFAPAFIGGMYWKGGTRLGAIAGLFAGFGLWGYTLVLPSIAQAGFISDRFLTDGPFGLALLHPFALLGIDIAMFPDDHIAHAVFWSLLANTAVYVGVSLFSRVQTAEQTQALLFVDIADSSETAKRVAFWKGTARVPDLRMLLIQFLGKPRAMEALSKYGKRRHIDWESAASADADFVRYAESLLAGVIGSASARAVVASVVKEEPLSLDEVMGILNETRQAIAHSRELEKATTELREANERLKEMDRIKDEFMSTVTHELRTPLTAIYSIAEILHDHADLAPERLKEFSAIIIKESQRLTRLINQVLDFQKIESGALQWQRGPVNMIEVIQDSVAATSQIVHDKRMQIQTRLPERCPTITGDRDRLVQVLVNLISNAVKFCDEGIGRIDIGLRVERYLLRVDVTDNGIGISKDDQSIIFNEFRQVSQPARGRPAGSGLGLSIAQKIIRYHGGRIWVTSSVGQGSTFSFTLPLLPENRYRALGDN